MKIKNKQERGKIAADVFKRYPKSQKVGVASDGMAFIVDESEAALKNHANKNRSGKVLSYDIFDRDEMEKGSNADSGKKTAKDLIAEIEAATEVEVVNGILEAENSGEKRKTVIDAAEKRLEELKPTE